MWRSVEAVLDAFVMLLIGKLKKALRWMEFQCSKCLCRCTEKAWKCGAVPLKCDGMVNIAAEGRAGSDSGTFLRIHGRFIAVGLLP